MSTQVVMPQMGESIAEGTIVRWIKKVGRQRRSRRAAVRDLHRQGGRGDPVAGGGRAARDRRQGRRDGARSTAWSPPSARRARRRHPTRQPGAGRPPLRRGRRRARSRPRAAAGRASTPAPSPVGQPDGRRQRSSPLVRRIAKEHGVDIARISGTGAGGRVTKHDILEHLASSRLGCLGFAFGSYVETGGVGRGTPVLAFKPGERVEIAADVGDAQEDRRAHGAQQAHLGARLLGVRSDLHAGRARSARRRKDEYERAGRQADLHVVHRQGGRATPCAGTR